MLLFRDKRNENNEIYEMFLIHSMILDQENF